MYRSKLLVSLAIFSSTLIATGCGSSNANVRLVNALPTQASINFLVDGNSQATGVGFGAASSYVSVSTGSHHLQAETTGGTNVVLDLNQTLGSGSYSTALAATTGSIVLTDSHTTPPSGDFAIRVVNASAGISSADVYILASGADINTATPTYSALTLNSGPAYANLAPGTYQVIFTFPNQKTPIIATSSLSFSAGQVRTVVGLDGFGGGSPTASVLSDFN